METITIQKNYDGHDYVVKAIPWVMKEQIRIKHTQSNPATQTFRFDDLEFSKDMLKATVTKNGKELTDADIDTFDAHSGEVINRAVNLLNGLSLEESRNLQRMPTWTISKTP